MALAQPSSTPGLDAVQAVTGVGDPAAMSIVQIMRAHADERDAIMTWLHQHRGNAFVQQVIEKTGEVERALPAGVQLQSVTASIAIPGKRKLGGGYWQGGTVKTKQPTQIGVEVTPTGVKVWVSPAMYLDADWPLQDCEINGAGLEFAKKLPYADVTDVSGLGTGMISIAGRVGKKLTDMISKAVDHTKLVSGTYDPVTDTDLSGTLNSVMAGFVDLFSDHDGKEKTTQPPIQPEEMKNISAGATIAVVDGASFIQGGSGLTLGANSPITISVDGAGNLRDTLAAKDPEHMAEAARIQQVSLSTAGLEVIVSGKPVAKLERITLASGGKVTIDQMTPLGKLADAEATESGLSLLGALIALRANDPSAGGMYQNAQRPVVVDGVSRAVIEQNFTDTLHKLILQYRAAVPGVDLAKVLGIG